MEVRSLQALQAYAQTREPLSADKGSAATGGLGKAAQDFGQTIENAEKTAISAMTSNADPHALVEALANTQIAVETAVTVRDRVVEAYQEILRMPV